MHSLLFSLALSVCACNFQYAAAMPSYLLLPPLFVSCTNQLNRIYYQQKGNLQSLCMWDRCRLQYLRAPSFISRIGMLQTKLPSFYCCRYWSATFIHHIIPWSGQIILGPNLASQTTYLPRDSTSCITLQDISLSSKLPVCLHSNLSTEVFGQDVHLFLLWSLSLSMPEWQPVQLGWCACLNNSSWHYFYSSPRRTMVLFLPTSGYPSAAHCHDGELQHRCASYITYRLMVHYIHQALSISSLYAEQEPRESLSLDLQVEPTLLLLFSTHSKWLRISHRTISLSWNLTSVGSQKMAYRLLALKDTGIWSTFYNPYALQNNYSVTPILRLSRKKLVANMDFCTEEARSVDLSGELSYTSATLSLTSKNDPPVHLTLNTQKIKAGTYFFSHTWALYYSTQETNLTNASGNLSSIHYIFYQQQSLSYLITIEFLKSQWYKFNLHLYLNRKGGLLRSLPEKDIEIHIFNSGPSFLQSLVYVVWFIPLQHPLLHCKWTFNLQLFDSRREHLLQNSTYTYRDRFRNAAHFIPHSALSFNPALYTGFVSEVKCTRCGRAHVILKATVHAYASKTMESTVVCLQRICFINKVKILKSGTTNSVLNYSKRKHFALFADAQVNCSVLKQRIFFWKIYKVPNVKTAPDWSNPFNPPGIGRRNHTMIRVPGSSLDYGLYLFNFTVKLMTVDTLETVEGSDSVFVEIGAGSLVAVIAGGYLQTVGFSNRWTLDGSASSDLDSAQPFEGLVFTWYCTKQKADYTSMALSANGKCHPEQADLKWSRSCDPIQTVQPETLQENATYYFRLIVQKGSRTAQAEQMVHVQPSSPLVLDVACIENCGRSLIPTERFCLSGKCLNCRRSSRPLYHWSLFSGNSTELHFDWDTKTTTGRTNSYICINPFSFVDIPEQSYSLVLKVSIQGDKSSVYNYLFFVNSPPLVGNCVLNPPTGMAFLTKFIIQCHGFKDTHLPLTYKVKAALDTLNINRKHPIEKSTFGTIVYFGHQPKIPASFLPIGEPSKQYALTVYVEVYDALGAYSQISLQTTVHSVLKGKQTDVILNQLNGLSSGRTAPITTFLKSGDYFSAGYFVYMVASTLNDIEGLQRFHSTKSELREILLNRSIEIPTTEVMEANQMISCIFQITQEITEVNRKSQLLAVRKLKEVSKELKKHRNKDLGSKETEVLGTAILAGLSNVLKASLLEHKNVHRNGIKATISTTEVLVDLILHGKVPGENETIMEVKDWTIILRKDEKWDVPNAFSKRKDSKNLFFPKIKQEEGDKLPGDAVVSTVLYEFDKNPFPWLPYTNDICTGVTGFKMTATKSNGDMVKIVPDTAEITMNINDEKSAIFEIKIGQDRKLSEATGQFSFEVFRQSKNIFIQIVTKMKLTFQVFIYLGLKVNYPAIASFSVSHDKPSIPKVKNFNDDECALQTPYVFCLSQTLLRSIFQSNTAEKLNISIVLKADLFVKNERTQLIGIQVFTADCLYLDGVDSHWKEGFCSLGPQISWQKLHCICTGKRRISRTANPQLRTSGNDITFVAGKVTPYSNLVETKIIQSTQIYKNPVTTLTVLFIFITYIFLAIWTMRKDRADVESRVHVIVLPDNGPFDKMCYLVTIFTGSRLRAGTTADVFIQLVGERATSDVHCLKHPAYLTFSRGAINTFLLTTKNDLGIVYCLRIWHNNAGSSPNWFLSRVKVENIFTKQCWLFMCQKWLSLDTEDSLIERSFVFTQPTAPLNKMYFFLISFANDLVDNHLWLSIFAHVCTGSFNRLQRLSCCLPILLCILLFNIMFFSTDEDQQRFSKQLHYLRPIIFGILGACISFPLQITVAALFKYSQNEPSAQNPKLVPSKEYSAFMPGSLRNWKEYLQKWYLIETASKIPGDHFHMRIFSASDSEALNLEQQKKMKWEQTAISCCTISEGDANIIAAEEDMPQDAKSNSNFKNYYLEKSRSHKTRPQNIPIMLFPKRPQIKISWWNKYILWMLVLIISTLSSFFIILYGLPYDYETSLDWLAASAISLWLSIFLLQPLNIGISSALKTLYPTYCKRIQWSGKESFLEIKLNDTMMDADDMRELHYDLVRMRGTKQYHPLEEDEITIFKKRQKSQHQAFVFIKDVISHFIFLILILNIAYSMENTTSFYYNQEIHNKISLGLSDVNKVEGIYTWLRNVFLPLIHNEKQPTYLLQTWSKIVGVPRMRQVRAKNTTKECFYPHSFVNKFVISKSHCLHKYGTDKEEQRDHLGTWTNPVNKSVSNKFSYFPGFIYQFVTDPWKYSTYGELNTYGAGGYTFNFYTEEQMPNSTSRIDVLESSNWLDENTWALIVEMTTFNSDVDLFCSISVVFEISHLGPVNTTLWIHSYKLPIFKELSKREKFVYIAVGCMLVFYIIDEFSVVERQQLKYLKEVSNLINFGIKAVCLFFLLQLAFKFKLAPSLIELHLFQPGKFIPFHKVSHLDKTLRITLGFLTFLIVLKTLRYSRFFYDVRLAQRSILAALPGICSMALVVAVYFFVYMAFGYLVFGQYEWNYNTMTHSAQTVFSYCVSAFKDTAFKSNRVLGGLFLASFMIVMICVLINLFQAVIMSAYENMKQPVYEEPSDEAEVVNFLFRKIQKIWFFVTCRKASTADTEFFNRVLFGYPKQRSTHHLGLKARKINGRKSVYLVL
nr:polycystic kidney disease and receptor for egg jelly-related protein [Pogona vitticeps]